MGEKPTGALETLNLVGDGDEIDAIENVEKVFGVTLDKADGPQWRTTGDVFQSLLRALPGDDAAAADCWQRFAKAVSEETGVDSSRVAPETTMIGMPWVENRATLVFKWVLLLALFLIIALVVSQRLFPSISAAD